MRRYGLRLPNQSKVITTDKGAVIWHHDQAEITRWAQGAKWDVVDLTGQMEDRRWIHMYNWVGPESAFRWGLSPIPLPPGNRMPENAVDEVNLHAGFEPGHAVREAMWGTLREVGRQLQLWGDQSHADGTGPHWNMPGVGRTYTQLAQEARDRLVDPQWAPQTWRDILLEEVFEALAEGDPDKLNAELEQVGAVVLSWCRDIARRRGAR